jgi:hypothetical protein
MKLVYTIAGKITADSKLRIMQSEQEVDMLVVSETSCSGVSCCSPFY